jgi:hypothetical protein
MAVFGRIVSKAVIPFPAPSILRPFSFRPYQSRRNTMGLSQFDPASRERRTWNAGRKVGPKRALKPRQIWAIRFFLDREGRLRDRALFDLAIDRKLRGCDLVKIKIGTWSAVRKSEPVRSWCNRRQAVRFSSG